MCGITGFLTPTPTPDDELRARVRRMADEIAHRGPDSAGEWADAAAGVALGHRRLAIIDLSPQGAQPMASHCGRYVAAYNGEIYNHLALRAELGDALPWRGHSDTETLLAGFTRWGIEATLPRLVGMFAIAVWDRRERALMLVRDRLGEKPLCWGRVGGDWAFASELHALRRHAQWNGAIDRDALALYMRHNVVPAPRTIHLGIHKLLPGAWVRLRVGCEPEHGRYWHAADCSRAAAGGDGDGDGGGDGGDAQAIDELERRLTDAVRGQMLADRPLGAFLSGGVDSSTVAALMCRIGGGPVRTFSIGFDDPAYDEAPHARAVARHLGTQHTEWVVSGADALAVVPRLASIYDEPFADSSQIPTALVTAMARRHVVVALSGDAGDELFAGYNRYLLAQRLWRRLSLVPWPLRRAIAAAIQAIPAAAWSALAAPAQALRPMHRRHALVGQKLHKLARQVIALPDAAAMYRALVSHWSEPATLVLGAVEPRTALDDARFDEGGGATLVEQMSLLDQQTYLPDDILVKVDRAAMAVSLETRVPLLDHRVVEFARRQPMHRKIRDGQTKWLLRQVLHRHVPRALIERPKQGFAVPLGEWLRGPLRDWAETLLAPERLRREGFLDPALVERTWRAHLAGQPHLDGRLWDVLMWQSWLERSTQPAGSGDGRLPDPGPGGPAGGRAEHAGAAADAVGT